MNLDALRGSTVPRLFVPPLVQGRPGPCGCGCALTPATSAGFKLKAFADDPLGIGLIPWQRWLSIHALEYRPDPDSPPDAPTYKRKIFRFRTLLILIARQNGKTTWLEVKNLWKMYVLGVPLILGAAQNLDIAEESWNKAVEIIDEIDELRDERRAVDRTNGKKQLRLTNGSRWKIVAATAGAGRGLAADDVNLDELREHKNWAAWGAITKTTMARPYSQTYAFSNAGSNESLVLNTLQATARGLVEQARTGPVSDDTMFLAEWSVPNNVRCDCGRRDPDPNDPEDIPEPHADECMLNDPALWAMANPSMGYGTISHQAIRSALNTDPTATFLTEVLCQRVPTLKPRWTVINEKQWEAQIDHEAIREGIKPLDVAFCIQVSQDRRKTAIVAVGQRRADDEHLLVALVEWRDGTAWVPARARELLETWDPVCFVVQDKGPTGALESDVQAALNASFTKRRIPEARDKEHPRRGDIINPWASDVADAYGQFVDHVRNRRLWHLDEKALHVALATAQTRLLSGATAWDGATDAPLIGVTLGAWGRAVRLPQVTSTYDAASNIG